MPVPKPPEIRTEFVKFRVRADRPTYIGKRFRSYFKGTVLDVGCDQAVLRRMLQPDSYTGVGTSEEADVKIDLEREGRLPFEDTSWDTVLCLDTLEHLNNLHDFCSELFRVARKYVIISLPNCWSQARRSIGKGSGAIWQYGLPLAKPIDRHKWFFNTEEACAFLIGIPSGMQDRNGKVRIAELVLLENKRPLINRIWRRIKHPSRIKYINLYTNTIVCVYAMLTAL